MSNLGAWFPATPPQLFAALQRPSWAVRHYYRHEAYRVALPDPSHPDFLTAYTAAKANDPLPTKSASALKAPKPASVYVIAAQSCVKVGVASRPEDRIRDLRIGSGERLTLLDARTYPTRREALAAERQIHNRLSEHRTSGEWFAVPSEAAIEALHAVQPRNTPTDRRTPHGAGSIIRSLDL